MKIILGICSSIAAYRACDLARLFVKEGCEVYPILTENAKHLVSPLALETLTGQKVRINMYDENRKEMSHINLKEGASLLCVAPATANIIGKFASGIADDLLSTTFLSVQCPVIMAPAMNPSMYNHPAVQRNIEILGSWGVNFIGPDEGEVACGDEGKGRLADIDHIFRESMDVIKRI